MDRRGPARIILALFVALVSILGPATATSAGVEPPPPSTEPPPTTQPDVEPADEPEGDRPIPTVSDFYPEDNNLSDCLGLVERPGCGSESRGGWRQTAVFVVLALGMALIFWRISVGVRRNRVDPPAERRISRRRISGRRSRARGRISRRPNARHRRVAYVTPDDFRRNGHDLIDWIADYLEEVGDRPVQATVAPGDVRAALPEHPPTEPESFDTVMADVERVIMPGVTNWQHPNWFAYFPANNSYPSILGELLSAGLGVQGMSWVTSPACTELETLMLDWMQELLDLPERFRSTSDTGGGVIHGSASEATLVAILSARFRATSGAVNVDGDTSRLVAYATSQSHSSIEKGLRIAGIGTDRLRVVPHDDAFAMRPDALAEMITTDRAAGLVPFFVNATLGTTSSTAFDPITSIGPICRQAGVWLHVDGAMAGIAALAPEFRWVHNGIEFADSYCTNPHKWMGVNFDCTTYWTSDRASLLGALSILPEYLRSAAAESGAVIDYRDWQVPLGRRFRALKLWFTIRCDGNRLLPADDP